jgi:hypothetical protein
MRVCPTRADGVEALMAHTISIAECQKRQREHFHKCPTCVHQNANAAAPVVAFAAASREAPKPNGG